MKRITGSYLTYYKQVLSAVYGHESLFKKEYTKAMNHLNALEKTYLDRWLSQNFQASRRLEAHD